jgi:hypothetical protein
LLAAGLSQLAHVAVGAPLTTMKKPQQQKAKGAVEKGFQQGTNLMMPPPTTARLSGWLNATPQQVENAARRPVVTPLTDVVTLGGADAAATPLSAVCKPEDATASIPATATTTFAHTTPGTHLSNNLRNDDDSNFVNDTPFSPPAAPPAFAADDAHAAAVAALLAASPGTAMAADILASAIGAGSNSEVRPGRLGSAGRRAPPETTTPARRRNSCTRASRRQPRRELVRLGDRRRHRAARPRPPHRAALSARRS